MRHRWARALVLILAASALAVACAQHVKKGSVAVVQSEELEVDLETGSTQMTGNVRINVKGDYTATMSASSVTVTADLEKAQVLSFEARGPVELVLDTTTKDGKPLHVVARCSQKATFSEQTMLATMVGNAHAEMAGGAAIADRLESFKYDGESVVVDLKNRKIRVKNSTTELHMAPEAPQPPAEPGNP